MNINRFGLSMTSLTSPIHLIHKKNSAFTVITNHLPHPFIKISRDLGPCTYPKQRQWQKKPKEPFSYYLLLIPFFMPTVVSILVLTTPSSPSSKNGLHKGKVKVLEKIISAPDNV
jgi:hypothetical protein